MIDIVSIRAPNESSEIDIQLYDAQSPKAANVLAVQLGSLEYAKTFGVDMEFFLDPDYKYQTESFKAYLIQRLSESLINVNEVIETVDRFTEQLTFYVGDPDQNNGSLIR